MNPLEYSNSPSSHQSIYKLSYSELLFFFDIQKEAEQVLMELVPDSRYRVKIQTVNEFGKSHWSQDFEFDTYGGINTNNKTLTLYKKKILYFQHKPSGQVCFQHFLQQSVPRQKLLC